jgi:hypothetical protein
MTLKARGPWPPRCRADTACVPPARDRNPPRPAVEGLDLAHCGVDGLALGERRLLLGQPGPTLDAEQI